MRESPTVVVTIDGPAGAGKSSAARLLADRLKFAFLDTGAMYRAMTLAALRAKITLCDETALSELQTPMRLDVATGKIYLSGEDVSGLIRSPEVTAASAPIANSPTVRRRLVEWQRAVAAEQDIVSEGRDQGTIVFPDAPCKFYLLADPPERARRRQLELSTRGVQLSLQEILQAQEDRDRRDAARDIAPMKPAADANIVDNTHMSLEDVVNLMEKIVQSKKAQNARVS